MLGIKKYGENAKQLWQCILSDLEFSDILKYRSGVDLKDKYRNLKKK